MKKIRLTIAIFLLFYTAFTLGCHKEVVHADSFISADYYQLELQRSYIDFDIVGRLFSKELNVSFYSGIASPENRIYELDGYTVFKKTGTITATETLKTRVEPSIESEQRVIDISLRFGEYGNYLTNPQSGSISLVFPNEVFYYDAVTQKTDSIDGFDKPWYRIRIHTPVYYYTAWIYGGYVKEVESYEFDMTDALQYLIDNGYANPDIMHSPLPLTGGMRR